MSRLQDLIELATEGPFRASDATAIGIPRSYLQRWLRQGVIERLGYGIYRLVEAEPSELGTIAEVARRAPKVAICLLSALEIHGLTTESPHAVWIMVEGRSRAPRIDFVQTQVVRASGSAFAQGIKVQMIEGVAVKVTTPAKTVADCFRYRRHLGMEVALEALRDYIKILHDRSDADYTVQKLVEAMRASRVSSVMWPYAEAMI